MYSFPWMPLALLCSLAFANPRSPPFGQQIYSGFHHQLPTPDPSIKPVLDIYIPGSQASQRYPGPSQPRFPAFPVPPIIDERICDGGKFDDGVHFASQINTAISRYYPGGNYLFSPFGLYLALGLTSFGARGQTEAQLCKVLNRADTDSTEKLIPYYIDFFNSIKGVDVTIASHVLVSRHYEIGRSFQEIVNGYYRTPITQVYPGDAAANAGRINSWVAEKTRNSISQIVDPREINNVNGVVVLNAVYFKGSWALPFQRSQTTLQPFYVSAGYQKNVPTMYSKEFYFMGELTHLNARFIMVPYHESDMNLIIVTPNQPDGLRLIESHMQELTYSHLTLHGALQEVNLHLPKFTVHSRLNIADYLKTLGVHNAFSSAAELRGISRSGPLYVQDIIHKAVLVVDEVGTEAPAVTATHRQNPLQSYYAKTFKVDRPSLLMVTYKNINLLTGRLYDPLEGSF